MKHTEKIAEFKILLYLVFAIISLINIVKAQGLIEIDLHGVDLKKESLETNFGINKLRDILGLSKDYKFECLNDSNISNYDFYGEHIFYLQYYKGIKIDGAILGVHLKQRNINSIEGHYLKMESIDTSAMITETGAMIYAENYIKNVFLTTVYNNIIQESPAKHVVYDSIYPKIDTIICYNKFDTTDITPHIAYRLILQIKETLIPILIDIDAKNGDILNIEVLLYLDNGIADTRHSGQQNISTMQINNNYVLQDVNRGGGIYTYNLKNKTSISNVNYQDNDNYWSSLEYHNTNKDDAGLEAHWASEMTYDYFNLIHGRNYINGIQHQMINYVNANLYYIWSFSSNNNAGWTGSYVVYGEGNSNSDAHVCLDVVAHEYAHGLYNANDFKFSDTYEAPALSEGFSDIFGACVSNYVNNTYNLNKDIWTHGSDIQGNYLIVRKFRLNDIINSNYYPSTYKGNNWDYNNEGHVNCTVLDYWFYLLCEGGSGINDSNYHYNIDGIGIEKAERIIYLARVSYINKNTITFLQVRQATINAAIFLYGVCSKEVSTVIQAWNAVGVTSTYKEVKTGSNYYTGKLYTDKTINTLTYGSGDIVVGSGKTLTITSTLKLAPETKIIVEQGAKLVVNGGTITSACDEAWGGIVLGGNNNLPQTASNQGVVELTNATIENGNVSISTMLPSDWNTTGGIIQATNTVFRNNNKSVEFLAYDYYDSINNEYLDNVSYFRNCTFIWTDDMLPLGTGHSYMGSHITMYQVRGVEVSGCTFKDERTDIPSSTHGLLTLESGFTVNNYNTTEALFNNLTFGIKTDNSGTRLCDIENAEFTNNYCGINTTTSNNLVITNNVFNIRPKTFTLGGLNGTHIDAEALGVFVESSPYPNISYNDFIGTSRPYSIVGLQVKNLGTTNSVVNNNSFSSLYAGTQALGYNRGVTQGFITKGLQYRCNSFSNCNRGIFVTDYGETYSSLQSGIHPNQGSMTEPANNTFTSNSFFVNNDRKDISNFSLNSLTYYYYGLTPPSNCVNVTLTQATSSGNSCGTIGHEENRNLIAESYSDEDTEESTIDSRTVFDTINTCIENRNYTTAKTMLQNIVSTTEETEEVSDYITYITKIEEFGNSYNIPDNDLIELASHNTQVGKKASAMVYFKNLDRDYLPRVVKEEDDTQDSDTTAITNKMKEQSEVKELATDDEYTLSPNPANSEVVVKGAKEIREITIMDLQGKELKSFYNTEKFNISFLQNGTYIIRIKDSENNVHYQKLIKQ